MLYRQSRNAIGAAEGGVWALYLPDFSLSSTGAWAGVNDVSLYHRLKLRQTGSLCTYAGRQYLHARRQTISACKQAADFRVHTRTHARVLVEIRVHAGHFY